MWKESWGDPLIPARGEVRARAPRDVVHKMRRFEWTKSTTTCSTFHAHNERRRTRLTTRGARTWTWYGMMGTTWRHDDRYAWAARGVRRQRVRAREPSATHTSRAREPQRKRAAARGPGARAPRLTVRMREHAVAGYSKSKSTVALLCVPRSEQPYTGLHSQHWIVLKSLA